MYITAAQRNTASFDRAERVDRTAPEQAAAPASPPDAVDTVEISDEARAALRASGEPPFTAEDLSPLKSRFGKLLGRERAIFSRLSGILSKPGFKRGAYDQLKVEIDSKGRAIVGGVSDVKTARALEKAINGDPKLLKEIVDYQAEEKSLSTDLHTVTGMSLKDYADRIDSLQRRDEKQREKLGTEDALALKDQPLHGADPEFAEMLSERFTAGSAFMDISGLNNILEDAEGTVNTMMRKTTGGIAGAFKEMNKAIRQDAAQADDPAQYIEDSIVDINRLKISVDNTGKVTIEGTASRNNPKTDQAAKKIVAEMFEEELKANPATGEQHDFKIAAAYLLNSYDETFGEGNPLGLGEADRTLEAVFDHGKISSRVSSPEREAELKTSIAMSAKDALKDMGVDADNLEIEMNDDGKLVAANLDPNDPAAKEIQTALDFLNRKLDNRTLEDAHGEENAFAQEPVKRLRGLMANMDVLRPGGTSLLRRG